MQRNLKKRMQGRFLEAQISLTQAKMRVKDFFRSWTPETTINGKRLPIALSRASYAVEVHSARRVKAVRRALRITMQTLFGKNYERSLESGLIYNSFFSNAPLRSMVKNVNHEVTKYVAAGGDLERVREMAEATTDILATFHMGGKATLDFDGLRHDPIVDRLNLGKRLLTNAYKRFKAKKDKRRELPQ